MSKPSCTRRCARYGCVRSGSDDAHEARTPRTWFGWPGGHMSASSRAAALTMNTVTAGSWARVRLRPDCPGDGRRPHHPAEEDCRVEVTSVGRTDMDGDHTVFALYKGGGGKVSGPPGGLGIGRCFRPDELEPIPAPD
jgi:hypothetical protein